MKEDNNNECDYCKDLFSSKDQLRLHRHEKHTANSYSRNGCGKTFVLKDKLKDHMHEEHKEDKNKIWREKIKLLEVINLLNNKVRHQRSKLTESYLKLKYQSPSHQCCKKQYCNIHHQRYSWKSERIRDKILDEVKLFL